MWAKECEWRWFRDAAVCQQLPSRYRIYAGYLRYGPRRSSGEVLGGAFAHRLLARADALLGCDKLVAITLGSSTIICRLSNPRVWCAFREASGYDAQGQIIASLLNRGDTFIDLGANHGGYSILAARCVGQTGYVVAVEPQPTLAHSLRLSLERSLPGRTTTYQVAAGARQGTADLLVPHRRPGSAGLHRAHSADEAHGRVSVPVAPVDDLLRGLLLPQNVVLKIDVEGNELEALQGAEGLLAERTPTIIMEINPQSARAAGYQVKDLVGYLASQGYKTASHLCEYPRKVRVEELDLTRQTEYVFHAAM